MLFSMRALPQLSRIEAATHAFRVAPSTILCATRASSSIARQFMLLDLHKNNSEHAAGASARACASDRWNDRLFAAVRKIDLSVLREITSSAKSMNQYRSRAGALRFLKEHHLLPGCGQFVAGASFVLRQPGSDELIAALLTEREVSPGVRATPRKFASSPSYQGPWPGPHAHADSAGEPCASMKFSRTSPHCHRAKSFRRPLYENLHFTTIRSFTAASAKVVNHL